MHYGIKFIQDVRQKLSKTEKTMIKVKWIYESPGEDDRKCFLVERLWLLGSQKKQPT
ncbi:MAG: hypothetical protein HYW01_02515 [Deltaproteobacteria bacterium]|nr:hypothetical protein [Deltaproteobacteria bacterium]